MIACSVCNYKYHLFCSGVSIKRFNLMTKDHKNAWKCNSCWDLYHKNSKQSSTPNNSYEKSLDYVTQRKKFIVNVSTDNSFSSLPSDEELGNNSETTITLNRSYPELNTCNTMLSEEMKEKIAHLEEKLNIADNEIVNILSENFQLKNKIIEYEQKIKHLTVICKCTNTLQTTTKKNKRKSLQIKRNSQYQDNKHEKDECSYNALNIQKGLNDSMIEYNKERPVQERLTIATNMNPNKCEVNTEETKVINKILIIGENSVSGLASTLSISRRESWNNSYSIFGYVQPNASSTQILNYCNNTQQDLTEKDIVVLGIGGHDDNPNLLHSNFCLILSKLTKCTVYIVPVNFNSALNELTLNNHLKLWSQNFKNCIFIESLNNALIRKKSYFTYLLTQKLNMLIDTRDYNSKFLSLKNCKDRKKISKNSIKPIKSDELNKSTCLSTLVKTPYTIPYFFEMMKKKASNGITLSDKTCFRP